MRIKSIRVENFRSVKSQALACDDLTALVGANGAGKSTFLRALLVFQGTQKADAEDFYNRDTDKDIEIAVTFTDLPAAASAKFTRYIQGGGLEVVRVCRYGNGEVESSLHGISTRNPDFDGVRVAPRAADALARYDELRKSPDYAGLPTCTSKKAALEALDTWEDANPGKCSRSLDDGSFFGFEDAAKGPLGQFVKMLYIPVVQEAVGDGTEGGRGSVLRDLLDLTVKNALADSARYQELQEATNAAYREACDVGGLSVAKRLRDDINYTLGIHVRGAEVDFTWDLKPPPVGLPTATIRLAEDGYSTTIDRTGHGLQRALIVAMLSLLHSAQAGASAAASEAGEGGDAGGPSIVFAMEEPELYQHPTRARHLAGMLSSISRGELRGVASSVQVIYATHSPYFVGADRIEQVRILRKVDGSKGRPGTTRVWSTDMDRIRKRLATAGAARRADQDKLEHDFDRILTPLMREGFFAGKVVLVEGDSDRIAVMRAAEMLGTPLDGRGVAVIPCGSKSGLPGPLAMFLELGVRTYVVWDGDGNTGKEKRVNARLLSLLGRGDGGGEDGWLGVTTDDFACFRDNLEVELRSDMGEDIYDRLVSEYRKAYRLKERNPKKPLVTRLLMREIEKRQIRPACLGRIVNAILGGAPAEGSG